MKVNQNIPEILQLIKNKQNLLEHKNAWLSINIQPELLAMLLERGYIEIDETISLLDHNNLVFIKSISVKADQYL